MVAICGTEEDSDALISVDLKGEGISVNVTSRNKRLFGRHIEQAAREACAELNVSNAAIEIKDFGALDFVIKARTKTAIKEAQGKVIK